MVNCKSLFLAVEAVVERIKSTHYVPDTADINSCCGSSRVTARCVVDLIRRWKGDALVVDIQALEEFVDRLALVALGAGELAGCVASALGVAAESGPAHFVGQAARDVPSAVPRDAGRILDRQEVHAVQISLEVEEVDSKVRILADVLDVLRELLESLGHVSNIFERILVLADEAIHLVGELLNAVLGVVKELVNSVVDLLLDLVLNIVSNMLKVLTELV